MSEGGGNSCSETAAGCLLLCLIAAGGIYYWFTRQQEAARLQDARAKQQLEARRSKIPISAVELSGLRMSFGAVPELTGRIANRADRDSVSMVDVDVVVYDCPRAETRLDRCATIATDRVVTLETVPPGQSRDFRSYVTLPPALSVRGRLRWTYQIASVTATSP